MSKCARHGTDHPCIYCQGLSVESRDPSLTVQVYRGYSATDVPSDSDNSGGKATWYRRSDDA